MEILYKYRGIQSFRYVVDILLYRRLYASEYLKLNDPMEGHYLLDRSGKMDKDIERKIKGQKEKVRLCSLSRRSDIDLMWAHYAEGERGIAVGVTLDKTRYDVRPVRYDGLMHFAPENFSKYSALEILSCKIGAWNYEEEERVFVKDKHHIDVTLQQVICGRRMATQDRGFLQELMRKVCPDVEFLVRE